MLKKRKSPLTALFPEREGIRIQPVKDNSLMNSNVITISGVKIDQTVKIDKNFYLYKGQKLVKKSGFRKTIYLFQGVGVPDKEFSITRAPTFIMVDGNLVIYYEKATHIR